MPNKLSMFVFNAMFLLHSVNAYSRTEVVPDAVQSRAAEIAIAVGGKGTYIKAIQRAPDAPGMRQATQVIYVDGRGALQNLIMLPDGLHFIAGPIAVYNAGDKSISDANGKVLIAGTNTEPTKEISTVSTPAVQERQQASTSTVYEPFKLDGIFRFSNLTSAGKSVFKDPVNAPENYYSLLKSANGIKDGKGGHEIFVLIDTACPYCMKKYEELQPLIGAGEITVYWIPVVGPSRPPYSNLVALTDPGLTNDERLTKLKAIANNMPLDGALSKPDEAKDWLTRTTALLSMIRSEKSDVRSAGTPQMFFKSTDGVIHHQYGYNESFLKTLKADLNIN
ncbi:DsbA family protein [Cellvibrio sp. QJXJ]|uniref:DsbA family protein n=1 Tax=Cellvibrio sp. QJXJ TaxID=2964606 RepID=UPI0021C4A416|nr:hypothetical protein [Cellvibrio sp. QJXJ]UUA75182.1 hypothetical protein NNX04_22250 [Cellvibrio sp. QJXJ]